MSNIDFVHEAIKSLRPKSGWGMRGREIIWELDNEGNEVATNIIWNDTELSFPTRAEVESKIAELQAIAESLKYQGQRRQEYPPLADLADAIYWQSQGDDSKMNAYLEQVTAVKNKYPKGTV